MGNPPYIDSETMVKNGLAAERAYLLKHYHNLSGNWDIYMAFFELALSIGKITIFITPDKWLSKNFGLNFRKNSMVPKMKLITRAGSKVFENAIVDAIITMYKETEEELLVSQFIENNRIKNIIQTDISTLEKPYLIDFLFSDSIAVINKIDSIKNQLINYAECEGACAVNDAYEIGKILENKKNPDLNNFYKLINTGTIDKYHYKWGEKEITYLGEKLLYPVVNKKKFETLFGKTYIKRANSKKIIFKSLNLLDVCLDKDSSILPGKSTMVICSKDLNLLKFLCGLLNSKLVFFYMKIKYASSSYCGGISFSKEMINYLPLKFSDIQKQSIISLVDEIILIKKNNPFANTKDLEQKIDKIVYELYELTQEEIDIIEHKL
ncbi:MAG: Eco57I restriction-modification methylase domain-containing protein [Endomicrobiaceae bacterium]|nr:Eco57I restriction-modification methylase domain-containing protein [Endomicrobiaceae bacterium]